MKVCVLLSGGMDSVTVLYDALRRQQVVAAMKPQEIVVRGEFAPRGGIQLTTEATYPDSLAASS